MTAKKCGDYYEQQALSYLQNKGCKLIMQNFSCRCGEIDLIFLEKNIIIFVEVRYRRKNFYGSATESVNSYKQRKIKKTAQYFFLIHSKYQNFLLRFDVIAIDNEKIEWFQNAF